jgi:hypothetical protein
MKISIQSTSSIITLNGVPARVWEGQTEGGIEITCFITRVAVKNELDSSELDRELKAQAQPVASQSWPLSMIL